MFFIMLIVLAAVGYALQYFLGLLQIKNFSKNYIDLRHNGKVAIGRKPSIFKSGTLVLVQINKKKVIEEVRYMQGVTVFAKFKKTDHLNGLRIDKLTMDDLKSYNNLLSMAIIDARNTFNIIQSGGEIQNIPSPFKRALNNINKVFKKREVY
ncbi:transcriptional regulator GutM [Staphylococcus delphini]|uniref:transcriptional regulator GutM n=1 Tax=Staphylococcus delphini TaxID=53344 RepID=UPI003365228A